MTAATEKNIKSDNDEITCICGNTTEPSGVYPLQQRHRSRTHPQSIRTLNGTVISR